MMPLKIPAAGQHPHRCSPAPGVTCPARAIDQPAGADQPEEDQRGRHHHDQQVLDHVEEEQIPVAAGIDG
jgi:hypothetical protein